MIYYFSATGNSRYVAERLSVMLNEKAISIAEMMKVPDQIPIEDGTIGIVAPIYLFGMPTIVVDFIQKLKVNGHVKAFTAFTYGGRHGKASLLCKEELAKAGIHVTHSFEIRMPDNFVPKYKVPSKDSQETILKAADVSIERIPDLLKKNTHEDHVKVPFFSSYRYRSYIGGRDTKDFRVTKKCEDNCEICAKACPLGGVDLSEGEPSWKFDKCVMCLSCLHRCPISAINIGRSEKNGRYLNPNVRFDPPHEGYRVR